MVANDPTGASKCMRRDESRDADVEVAIRPEREIDRVSKAAGSRVGELAEKHARVAVEPQHITVVGAVDVEIEPVRILDGWAEDHSVGPAQATGEGRDEVVDERPGEAVEADDASVRSLAP